MPTFVLRLVGDPSTGYRGRVRHVATGEEVTFSHLDELLAFLDQMSVLPSHDGDAESPEPGSPETRGGHRPRART